MWCIYFGFYKDDFTIKKNNEYKIKHDKDWRLGIVIINFLDVI